MNSLSSPVTRIAFYLDENVDQHIVDRLREHGITVVTAAEAGLLGEKDDNAHLRKATELGCVVITYDRDFGRINKEWIEKGVFHAGIVFIDGKRRRPPGQLIKMLTEIYETKGSKDMASLFLPI